MGQHLGVDEPLLSSFVSSLSPLSVSFVRRLLLHATNSVFFRPLFKQPLLVHGVLLESQECSRFSRWRVRGCGIRVQCSED